MKKFLSTLLIILLLVGAFYYLILWAPNNFNRDKFVMVSKGETFSQVADKLDKEGILRSKFLFKLAGRIHGSTKRIQIGKYRFRSGMSNLDILRDLSTGSTIEAIIVTIPEGWTSRRIAGLLAHNLSVDSVQLMMLVKNEVFLHDSGIKDSDGEGYLFPKTYKLYWQDTEVSILRQILSEFHKEFDSSMAARAHEIGFSVHNVLTLASIVEGETRIDSERAMIAGVYINRLKKNMLLQADPTIQFIIPHGPRLLKYSDLERDSPYNTYRYKGLPPGPVNNPGLASIKAVLYPRSHKYLFFVANGLGGHTFTKTYKAHLKAVKEYEKVREEKLAQNKNG